MSNLPSISDLAKSASASYGMTRKGSLNERLNYVNSKAPDGYKVVGALTNKDISTFKHETNGSHIIAHRGTDFSGDSTKADLKSDLNIVLGNTDNDALNKRRTKRTEMIVKKLKKDGNTGDIFLTSHSLGGASSNHAMANSKVVREAVTSHSTFNGGSSPLASLPHEVGSAIHKEIEDKSTHYRMQGDAVSENQAGSYIGKSKVYKQKKEHKFLAKVVNLAKPILDQSAIGKAVGVVAKKVIDTLNGHTISNFIDK